MNCPLAAARRNVDRGRGIALDQLSVLDHHHRIGAARDDAAGRNRRRGAGRNFDSGRNAAGDHFGIERKTLWRAVAGAGGIGGAHAQSRRHWSGRTAAHRPARPHRAASTRDSAAPRGKVSPGAASDRCRLVETAARLVGGNHFEKLLLERGGAHAREQRSVFVQFGFAAFAHFFILMATALPAPARRRHSLPCPPAPKSTRRTVSAPTAANILPPKARHCRPCAAPAPPRPDQRWK